MPSDRLFGPSLTVPAMAAAVSDEAWLRALLDVEGALAAAEARAGVIPVAAAAAIRAACAGARFDVAALGREAAASATPVVPLVGALRAAVGGEAADFVHWGATSQDVVDTAMMLVARRALDVLLEETDGLAGACAELAERHRATLMPGRTLLQQALPITFGLKAAGWLLAVSDARERLAEVRERRLAVQLGGAAGTLSALGEAGLDVLRELAAELGLAEPALPWHAARGRVAELGGALMLAAGAAGKVALDVALLAQTEVGEVREGAPGASSAMPHKANPVAAVEANACVRGLQAQVAVLNGALLAEHERAAGAWQAEWPALSEAFRLAGGAVGRTREALTGLRVDERRMRANLELTGGLVQSEAVLTALAARVGRGRAQELVRAAAGRAAAGGRPLREELLADREVAGRLGPEAIDAALDPGRSLEAVPALIERALALHRQRKIDPPSDPPMGGEGGRGVEAMGDELLERGMEVRRAVLGEAHVERALAARTLITAEWQEFLTRYAWGEVWARPGLDWRTRSCVTVAMLVALDRPEELALHLRGALNTGVTPDELREVLLQAAIYCGVPAANAAFRVAAEVLG